MNISEIEIQNVRPCSCGTKMVGNVTFHIRGGVGDRFDAMNFECRCDIPVGEAPDQQALSLKNNMKAEAIRQAERMPEFRSGEDVLVFLSPND